jgi:hypothetical protein
MFIPNRTQRLSAFDDHILMPFKIQIFGCNFVGSPEQPKEIFAASHP